MSTSMPNRPLATDYTGRRALYRRAVADARLNDRAADPSAFDQAALRAAVALGYCLLFQVPLGDGGAVLPEGVAVAAARRLGVVVSRWVRDAADPTPDDQYDDPDGWEPPVTAFADEWLDAPSPDDADAVAGRWLTRRTDVMAATVALAEVAPAGAVSDAVAAVRAGPLAVLDAVLETERVREIFGTVVETTPVRNLRDTLAGPFRDRLPWWLDPAQLPADAVWDGTEVTAEPEVELAAAREPVAWVAGLACDPFEVPIPTPEMAFATEQEESDEVERAWVKPDGTYFAILSVPAGSPTGKDWKKPRTLNATTLDGRHRLADATVRIGDQPGQLNSGGQAVVTLAEVAGPQKIGAIQLDLFVDGERWIPVREVPDGDSAQVG